jgi:hypothetical protein
MSPALILHERLVKAFFRSYFVAPPERRAFLQHHTLCDFHSSSIVLVKPSSRWLFPSGNASAIWYT